MCAIVVPKSNESARGGKISYSCFFLFSLTSPPPSLPPPPSLLPEVYVDERKQTYEALGYRRFNWLNIWKALLSRISRAAISEVGESHSQTPGPLSFPSLLSPSSPPLHFLSPSSPRPSSPSQARSRHIDGNLAGNGLQNGGLLIVSKGGEQLLLNHKEEAPGDHVANNIILQTLGIAQTVTKRLTSIIVLP